MWIIVHHLLDTEHAVLYLQHHTHLYIQCLILIGLCWIVSILHKLSLERIIVGSIHTCLDELRIQVLQKEELSGQIDHRALIAILIGKHQWWNTVYFSNLIIVSTECRSDMYDSGTIFCRYKVTCNNTERAFTRVYPWDKLFIIHAYKFGTFPFGNDTVRNQLVALLVIRESQTGSLRVEIGVYTILPHDSRNRHTRIGIISLNSYVRDIWSDAQCCVRR